MPILDFKDVRKQEMAPGVDRWELVSGEVGARSLTVADARLAPGSSVATHTHPTEEAMVIVQGELEAVLGDETVTVIAGQTVLAPPGVKHGFANRSASPGRIMAIHPTAKVERTLVD